MKSLRFIGLLCLDVVLCSVVLSAHTDAASSVFVALRGVAILVAGVAIANHVALIVVTTFPQASRIAQRLPYPLAALLAAQLSLAGPVKADAPRFQRETTVSAPTTTTTSPTPTTTTKTPLVTPTVDTPQEAKWIVQHGESFWSRAAAHVHGVNPNATTHDVSVYWKSLVDANRSALVDNNNANLIYPGQAFVEPS